MREFEKWMNIAANHEFVRDQIPLGYQPTLPLIFREDGKEYICYFYYHMTLKKVTVFLKEPKYYLQFDIKSECLTDYKEYDKEHELGYSGEFFQEDYAKRQQFNIYSLKQWADNYEYKGAPVVRQELF